jgi:hypothetical protein
MKTQRKNYEIENYDTLNPDFTSKNYTSEISSDLKFSFSQQDLSVTRTAVNEHASNFHSGVTTLVFEDDHRSDMDRRQESYISSQQEDVSGTVSFLDLNPPSTV